MSAHCLLLILSVLPFILGAQQQLWPIPAAVKGCTDTASCPVALAASFSFDASSSKSAILHAAAKRYTSLITGSAPAPPPPAPQCSWASTAVPCKADAECLDWVKIHCDPLQGQITGYCKGNGFCHLNPVNGLAAVSASVPPADANTSTAQALLITVASDSEELQASTDESYTLSLEASAGSWALKAKTIYGAMRGMETFSQLVFKTSSGVLSVTAPVTITDQPQYTHRGLMVDTARRFIPLPMLRMIIDGLSYSKMSVLHLHFSDEPAVRIQSKVYPSLTAHLGDAMYTQQQITELVAYAKERAVRIIPELDIPAHAGGLRVLPVRYCDASGSVLDGSNSGTVKVVNDLLTEYAGLFPDHVFHFGADEACKHDICPGNCTFEHVHTIEQEAQRTLTALGKVPLGWNDVFSDPKGSGPNAALAGTIIQNWGKTPLQPFTSKGFQAIDSEYQTMYLGQECCRVAPPAGPHDKYSFCFYKDSAQGVAPDLVKLVDGGEVAKWSDSYCSSPHCLINATYGWMYDGSQDATFEESFMNMVFPGTAAAAGSLWHYDSSLVSSQQLPTAAFTQALDAHTNRLIARGIKACKPGCACTPGTSCVGDDSAYYGGSKTPLNIEVKLTNTGCPFGVHIKQRKPCSTQTGVDLVAKPLAHGESFTVKGKDFIAVARVKGITWAGDPFSTWIGDGTWSDVKLDLQLSCVTSGYIDMN